MAWTKDLKRELKALRAQKKGDGLDKTEKKRLKFLKGLKAADVEEAEKLATKTAGKKRERSNSLTDVFKSKKTAAAEAKENLGDTTLVSAKRAKGDDGEDLSALLGGESSTAGEDDGAVLTPDAYRKKHEVTLRGPSGGYKPSPSWDAGCDDPLQDYAGVDAMFPLVGVHARKSFKREGFTAPSPIQSQSWPLVRAGHDIISVAKTGSGKTCGFLIPAFEHIAQTVGLSRPRQHDGAVCLVLAPTRELAQQIQVEALKFGRSAGIVSAEVYGGVGKGPQIGAVKRGVHMIVATPGRMNDFLTTKCFRDGTLITNAERTSLLILDEADRMLDMGFEPQLRAILESLPKVHQTLMFTATWPRAVQRLAREFLNDPVQVNIGGDGSGRLVANKSITQTVYQTYGWDDKISKLDEILKPFVGDTKTFSAIVFANKKSDCDHLCQQVSRLGIEAVSIHGDKEQWEREQMLERFKHGVARVIVATDVASRGLDIKGVSHVINFDFPMSGCEDWVHRVGRTGRAGATGEAHTFFNERNDKSAAHELERILIDANQTVPPFLATLSAQNARRGGKGGKGGKGRRGGKGGKGGFRGGKGGGKGFGGGKGGKGGKGSYSRW